MFHLLVVVLLLLLMHKRKAISTEWIELKFSLKVAHVPLFRDRAAYLEPSSRCCAVLENDLDFHDFHNDCTFVLGPFSLTLKIFVTLITLSKKLRV